MKWFARKKHRFLVLGVALVLVGGGLTAWALKAKGSKDQVSKESLIKVARKDLSRTVYLNGVVQPLRTVQVYSPVMGEIVDMPAKEATQVAKQALLFRVDPDRAARRELESALAAVERAQLELQNKTQALARQEKVEAYVAPATLESLRAEVSAARMTLADANRSLTTLRESLGLERSGSTRLVQVFAPIAGTITFVHKTVGSSVFASNGGSTGTDPVMVISDLSQVMVRSSVLETDIAQIREGLPVTIRLRAFPGKQYEGRVSRVSPQGTRSQESATFEMDVTVTNPDANFRANLSASLEVQVDSRKAVLVLPRNAVATFRNHSVVQLPEGKGFRAVEVGLANDTEVEITGASLAENEAVAEMDFEKLDLEKLGSGELTKVTPTATPAK